LKTWLLDADVIIDLLALNVFDNLVRDHQIYVSSSVANEIVYFKRDGVKHRVNFRTDYVQKKGLVELSASMGEVTQIANMLPSEIIPTIHLGELESLALMEQDLSMVNEYWLKKLSPGKKYFGINELADMLEETDWFPKDFQNSLGELINEGKVRNLDAKRTRPVNAINFEKGETLERLQP
jgi:hypothetical protein